MHHHFHSHPNLYFSTPFFFGFSIGQYRYLQPYPATRLHSLHVHVSRHYRTYNPATNTFFNQEGVPAVCVSPYMGY